VTLLGVPLAHKLVGVTMLATLLAVPQLAMTAGGARKAAIFVLVLFKAKAA
jgi:hypothetical protein